MPIDVARALAAELPSATASWGSDDAILYQLALGAGTDPTDPAELRWVYERDLRVLPSFATIPALAWLQAIGDVDGLEIDRSKLLHGEQELELLRPLPASGTVETAGRVAQVWDKGSGALIVYEATTRDADSGESLCVNRFATFVRGEGGFGGESGPPAADAPPERTPDAEVACPTLPQQALLYRLTGDKNPLHADPAYAARGGFERPILHGLCSYGIACKAAVDAILDGDVTRVAGYRARFAGVAFPGETLLVQCWDEGDRILLDARTHERRQPVITNAAITLRRHA